MYTVGPTLGLIFCYGKHQMITVFIHHYTSTAEVRCHPDISEDERCYALVRFLRAKGDTVQKAGLNL